MKGLNAYKVGLSPPPSSHHHCRNHFIMADTPSSSSQADNAGSAFFDSFFNTALSRANMSSSQLRGLTEEISSAAHPLPSSQRDVYAADGNGLDCGRDPGDVPPPPVEEERKTRQQSALANGVSSLNLGTASAGPSSSSTAYISPSGSSSNVNQMDARAAASALLSRTHSSSHTPSIPANRDIETLLTRGGGLGTPTGERTFIGTSFHPSTSGTSTPVMDQNGLGWPAKSTLNRLNHTPAQAAANELRLSKAIQTVLECIGEDPSRSGLQRTPERYAKALLWMTRGYEVRLSDVIANAIFDEEHDEMVIVRDIEIFSLCEHHLVPFTGKVSAEQQGKKGK